MHLCVGREVLAAEVVIALERLAAAPFLRHQRTLTLPLDRRIGNRPLGAVRPVVKTIDGAPPSMLPAEDVRSGVPWSPARRR